MWVKPKQSEIFIGADAKEVAFAVVIGSRTPQEHILQQAMRCVDEPCSNYVCAPAE